MCVISAPITSLKIIRIIMGLSQYSHLRSLHLNTCQLTWRISCIWPKWSSGCEQVCVELFITWWNTLHHSAVKMFLFSFFYKALFTHFVFQYFAIFLVILIKGIVHPKIKMTPWFTHPQAISVYDFLLSDECNLSCITKCLGSSKLYNGREWWLRFLSPKKCNHPS